MAFVPPVALAVTPPDAPGDLGGGGGSVESRPRFIPALKCAKVQILCNQADQDGQNGIYVYQSAGNFTYADCVTLATLVQAQWAMRMLPVMGQGYVFTGVRVSDASNEYGPVYEYPVEPNLLGAVTGTAANTDDCIGIILSTGLKGRSSTGKQYIGGRIQADFALSVPIDASRQAVLDAYSAFAGDIIIGGYKLAIVSFMGNKTWRTTAVVTTVAFIKVALYIYKLGRRLPGH